MSLSIPFLRTEKIFWFFHQLVIWSVFFGCVILEQAWLWVVLGLITMIEVDRDFEKSMLPFSSF